MMIEIMKYANYISGMLIAILLFPFTSCTGNFDDLNTDPDAATKATSTLLATGAIMGIVKQPTAKSFVQNQFYSKYLGWAEGFEDAQYNGFGRENFDGYTRLKDYQLMGDLANPQDSAAYRGLGLFLKAFLLFNYTLSVGDIPYKDILQGANGQFTPKYDTQKDVFIYLLKDLDRAYELMSGATDFTGDPVLGGKHAKWAKIITALELRVLINLSGKVDDSDLNVRQKFAQVVARGDLMESNDDNLQLVFSSKEGQMYPFNHAQNKFTLYPIVSTTLIDILQKNKDYRLFYYAAPSAAKLREGLKENEWGAYPGIDPSEPLDYLKDVLSKGEHCSLNDRYMYYTPGEPYIVVGYAEQNFILAEAALRGWIPDPVTYYKRGIKAAMRFTADHTPDDAAYNHGMKITDEVITNFLNYEAIQLTGDFQSDLRKVMEQKYVSEFMQLAYIPYYDYRRTGYPDFPINPETNMNSDQPTKIPLRWLYPTSEFDYNKKNVEEAIQRQYNGDDDVNAVMWILK